MATPTPAQLDALAIALTRADALRDLDVDRLGEMDAGQLDYLARVSELEDPATDGIEGRCV